MSMQKRFFTFTALALLFAGCATSLTGPDGRAISEARKSLNLAKRNQSTPAVAAGYYLDAANIASKTVASSSKIVEADSTQVYNEASRELALMLSQTPELWNRTETLRSPRFTYHLHFAPGSHETGVWDPAYFDFFRSRNQVKNTKFKLEDETKGLGGVLVGVTKPNDPRKYFYPKVGVAMPVTSTLDFAAAGGKSTREVTLKLIDPTRRTTIRMDGKTFPLAADFTAPLAYYPDPRLLGFEAMMRPAGYIKQAGIYLLEPYDPDRIPVLFVHGLISAPQMWFPTINAVESDPVLRGKFQYWVFGYPSGDPIAYSALQLRQSLDQL